MGLFSFWERLTNGSVWYYNINNGGILTTDLTNKIHSAKTNPILLPAIQLIADYFASARFYEKEGDEFVTGTKILKLLKNPNPYQSQDDFLKQFIWYKYPAGWDYIHTVSSSQTKEGKNKIDNIHYLYNLNPSLIEFPKGFAEKLIYSKADYLRFTEQEILYDKKKENKKIKVSDILAYYDIANGLEENNMTSPSRLDALKMPLSNIDRAFDAKNIVIQSNGKELITNETVGAIAKLPLGESEKKDIDTLLSTSDGSYGVGSRKKRSIVTNSALKWQSLHIKLAELGLDDSVIADALIVINGLNIPPEMFQVNGKSATFENQEKAIIAFLQSKIQGELDDFCNTINDRFGTTLVAKLDHLPIMRGVEKAKIASLRSLAFGLKLLVETGILTIAEAKEQYYKDLEGL